MQIFIRFAYGKVITIDICKKITTVKELVNTIKRRLKIDKSIIQFTLKFKDKIITQDLPSLVCSHGIKNNDIIDLKEMESSKPLTITAMYSKKEDDTKKVSEKWESTVLKGLNTDSTLYDLKLKVEGATSIKPIQQRVFLGSIELENDFEQLVNFGMDHYVILDYLYDGIEEKKEELASINNFIVYIVKREVKVFNALLKVNGEDKKRDIDETMTGSQLKMLAWNLCSEWKTSMTKDQANNTIKLSIASKDVTNNTVLKTLLDNSTYKAESVLIFTK